MTKRFALSLALALTAFTTFSGTARAEQPCVGSTSTCSWTCSTDGNGNIVNYSVSCVNSDWCVSSSGDVDLGLCDSVAPPSDDPVKDALLELEVLDGSMDGGTCDAPPPKKILPSK